MSWFAKISRVRGQPSDMGPDDLFEDPYGRSKTRTPKPKDRMQGSLGLGSETHGPNEMSGNGLNEKQINSLTSGYNKDEITDETPMGEEVSRTEFKGEQGATRDAPSVLGMEDDGAGNFILRHTPNDSSTNEVAIRNYLRFQQRRPSKTISINGHNVNVI